MMLAKLKQFILRYMMQHMGKRHQAKSLPKQVKNIAVWQFGGVGDMLLATPVLIALHNKYPQAEIQVYCSYPQFAFFLRRFSWVKNIHEFSIYAYDMRTLWHKDVRQSLQQTLTSMKKENVELLVNVHHPKLLDWWVVEWWIIAKLQPPYAMGFTPDMVSASLLDASISSSDVLSQHYTQSYQQLLHQAGIACGKHMALLISPEEEQKASALLQRVKGTKWFCLHMGGRRLLMEDKMWEIDNFLLLSRKLLNDGVLPVLIGVEGEQEMGEALCQTIPEALNLIGQTTLGEMAAVIDQAHAFIGHDSGPFHIAVAKHTPAVAICGRPDPEPEYLQYKQEDVCVLTAENANKISVDDVYQAAKRLF